METDRTVRREGLRCRGLIQNGNLAGKECRRLLIERHPEFGWGIQCDRCPEFHTLESLQSEREEIERVIQKTGQERKSTMAVIPIDFETHEMKTEQDMREVLEQLKGEYENFSTFRRISIDGGEQISEFAQFLRWLVGDLNSSYRRFQMRNGCCPDAGLLLEGDGAIAGLAVSNGRVQYDFRNAHRAIGEYTSQTVTVCSNCKYVQSVSHAQDDVRTECALQHPGVCHGTAQEKTMCEEKNFVYFLNDGTDQPGMRLEAPDGKRPRLLEELVKELFGIEL